MPRINLLPWRDQRRKERERQFYILGGITVAAAVVVISMVHMKFAQQIDKQLARNQFLNEQISTVDREISNIRLLEVEKARLLKRMQVIQELQGSRPEIVHLFEELVTQLPDGTRYLKIDHADNSLTLEGVADSNSLISALMRNLDKSAWLSDPELIVIDSSKKKYPNQSWFTMRVKRVNEQAGTGKTAKLAAN